MPYEVVGLLGRGGMAVVELAIDEDGRRVARKRLPLTGSVAEMEVARRRLRREAQVLARLEHPGIVPLLAVEDDGTDVVLVMPALAASLADRVRTEGTLAPAEVWRVGLLLLDALAWAHRQGVVHRDIKPANVLFDEAGAAALADFGIARSFDLTHGLTQAGALLGTPQFIAPEQARGDLAGPPSDVFSLGATLSYALTRRAPYGDGDPMAMALRAARGQVSPVLDGVPTSLAGPLQAMLDPRPDCRPSAASLLGGMSGTEPGHELPRRKLDRAGERSPRRLPPAPVVIERPAAHTQPVAAQAVAAQAVAAQPVAAQVVEAQAVLAQPVLAHTERFSDAPTEIPSTPTNLSQPSATIAPASVDAANEAAGKSKGPGAGRRGHAARAAGRILAGGPTRPATTTRRVTAVVLALLLALVATGVGLSLARHPSSSATPVGNPATTICAPLPYEPCGQPPAPHTNGLSCLPGWYAIGTAAAAGCPVQADSVDRDPLVSGQVLLANLVPVGEIDSYPLHVRGGSFFSCGPKLTVTLVAPSGVSDQLKLFNGLRVLGSATSVNGQPASVSVGKPSCFGSDAENLTVTVSGVQGASGANYSLSRTRGW